MRLILSTPLIAAFICLILMSGIAIGDASGTGVAIDNIKDFHSNFLHHKDKSPTGQLVLPNDIIYFPWYGGDETGSKPYTCGTITSSCPTKENIYMKGPYAKEQVQDLKSMNSEKQRDIRYEEVQNGDSESQGLTNSMDILVTGGSKGDQDSEEHIAFADNIENLVDSAITTSMNGAYNGKASSARGSRLGNSMNIEVSGITVSAINTVEGGSAVANSNIVIKPVQIITAPAEVDEKLK